MRASAYVHMMTPALTKLCRGFVMGTTMTTKLPELVTCPTCLKVMKKQQATKNPLSESGSCAACAAGE